jgi:hypothetical protein
MAGMDSGHNALLTPRAFSASDSSVSQYAAASATDLMGSRSNKWAQPTLVREGNPAHYGSAHASPIGASPTHGLSPKIFGFKLATEKLQSSQ